MKYQASIVNETSLANGLYIRTKLKDVELALLLLVRLQNQKRDFTTLTISKISRHTSSLIDEGTVRAAWESYKAIRGEGDNAIIFDNLRHDISHIRRNPDVDRVITEEETILQNIVRTNPVAVSSFFLPLSQDGLILIGLKPLSPLEQAVFEETFRGTFFRLQTE
ncbi:hypothetical protein TWF481_006244 [Arthrobotrys musiformis]|uniref:Uncharacterized protein n=1 Tax=Arthrobotrys musiformis TaxID=47236 RepID=A0AAV9WLU9_9PEZI